MSRRADPIHRLQEAALAYADAEDDGAHERGWMRLRFAALAYARSEKHIGRPPAIDEFAAALAGGEGEP